MPEINFSPVPSGPCQACNECGALVSLAHRGHWIAVHESWHQRVRDVMLSVEASDALAAELRERGDG